MTFPYRRKLSPCVVIQAAVYACKLGVWVYSMCEGCQRKRLLTACP